MSSLQNKTTENNLVIIRLYKDKVIIFFFQLGTFIKASVIASAT